MKKLLLITVLVLLILSIDLAWNTKNKETRIVTNFEECASSGSPVMESYPRRCMYAEQTFIENIGNELEKTNLIRLDTPRPNQLIKSPITIAGEARGYWFFEASFPVLLTNWDGRIIGQGVATTKKNWMTKEFVPFEAIITFTVDKNSYSDKGTLILKKNNPSGLSENDNALEIPVLFEKQTAPNTICSQEAKICPNGSVVGRTGPNCEFTKCPAIIPQLKKNCIKDSDCSSSLYVCQETQGTGTACPSTDSVCVPTHTILQGECKLKEGNRCTMDSECTSGNLCHANICTNPVGRECGGINDTSCPSDFKCVESCGPPVVQYPDTTPVKYFCQLNGYVRTCPICLAKNTLIDTPHGQIAVEDLQNNMPVWTMTNAGKRVSSFILKTSKTPVPIDHKMVHLILRDGRTLLVSPGHPTVDGRTAGDFKSGDRYDGSIVVSSDLVLYNNKETYDILPFGVTGQYWANDILIKSTLR